MEQKNYIVQSVIFDNEKFSILDAKKWLKVNNYKYGKVDKTENMLRFRQENPNKIEQQGYTEYRTKELGNSGIKLILAYKKLSNNNNMNNNNNWIQHVKDFAAKKGIKYNEALKDPACRASYILMKNSKKKGGAMCGAGVIDEIPNQDLIAQEYNQKQLGQHSGKKFVSL